MAVTLAQRIERMEDEGPIDPASIDFTVNNPELVGQRVGIALAFGEAVEIEVPTTANTIRTLQPNMSDELERFVNIWDIQETGHGLLLARPRKACGVEPLPTRTTVPNIMKFMGMVARISPGMHDLIGAIYKVEGAMGEKETLIFYNDLRNMVNAEKKESQLANLLGRIAAQEAAHLAYYMQSSRETIETFTPWQQWLLQEFVLRTYTPVGVRSSRVDKERKRHFGHTATIMTKEKGVEGYTDKVEKLARDLMGIVNESSNPFIRRRYVECIDEYEEYKKRVAA